MMQNLHKNTSQIKEKFLFLPTIKWFMVTGLGFGVLCYSEWFSPCESAVATMRE
jgi:hypothetical protein